MAFGTGLRFPQAPTKRKVFVSYHHRGDQSYYDDFAQIFHASYEIIHDNSLDRQIDSDDVDSGYAVWAHWEQITANPDLLASLIEAANSKAATLIRNDRERRLRNG